MFRDCQGRQGSCTSGTCRYVPTPISLGKGGANWDSVCTVFSLSLCVVRQLDSLMFFWACKFSPLQPRQLPWSKRLSTENSPSTSVNPAIVVQLARTGSDCWHSLAFRVQRLRTPDFGLQFVFQVERKPHLRSNLRGIRTYVRTYVRI